MAKKTAEPSWGRVYSDIPQGLPGRENCISSIKKDNAAALAAREKRRKIHAATARAEKKRGK